MVTMNERIKHIIESFYSQNRNPKSFLTEDDVRCKLFAKLHSGLRGFRSVSVHAEVRWYGGNQNGRNKLKYRSDLVVIDKNDLQINDNIFPLPSKGYGFNRYYAIIEIKLRRPNDKNSDNKYKQIIQKDINKLREIKERTSKYSNTINKKFFVIAFDKKRNKKLLYDLDINDSVNWEDWNS